MNHFHKKVNMESQGMRFSYLFHQQAPTAQTSLHFCVVSLEPLLLAFTKYESRERFRDLKSLDGWTWILKWILKKGT